MMPRVTVLMPAYNAALHIGAAIDSILQQTYRDFELLIIDDGSTDATAEIVRGISDPRLRYYRNERNLRLAATLNLGLELARSEFIARMDADDLAMPDRLERQVEYLEKHPDVVLLGAGMVCFSEQTGAETQLRPVTDPDLVRWRQLFSNQIYHPTVMFRLSVCRELGLSYGIVPPWARAQPGFSGVEHLSEDYLLFGLLALRAKVVNFPKPLLRYRVHAASVSNANAALQQNTAISVSALFFAYILRRPVSREAVALAYFTRAQPASPILIEEACGLIAAACNAHIAQYCPASGIQRRIMTDSLMRQRILRSYGRGLAERFLDFLRSPTWPRDIEELRLVARLLVSEQAVDWLKRCSMRLKSVLAVMQNKSAER